MSNIDNYRYRRKARVIISNLLYIITSNIKLKLKTLSIWELVVLRGEIHKHTYDILQSQTSTKKAVPSMADRQKDTFSHPLYILCEQEMSLRYNETQEVKEEIIVDNIISTLPKFNL